jgi:hypothetical protein
MAPSRVELAYTYDEVLSDDGYLFFFILEMIEFN